MVSLVGRLPYIFCRRYTVRETSFPFSRIFHMRPVYTAFVKFWSGKNVNFLSFWNSKNTYLYTARIEGIKNGKAEDVYEEPFGVRKVEVKDGKFYINGQSSILKDTANTRILISAAEVLMRFTMSTI